MEDMEDGGVSCYGRSFDRVKSIVAAHRGGIETILAESYAPRKG
jgi:hypothetical protein